MLVLTQGIVLRTVNYSDTSVIVTIYTRLFGLKSYIVKGINPSKNKKKSKQNLLQPLSLVEIVAYQKPTKNLQHIKEIRPLYLYKNIPLNPVKTSIFLFLHEIIYKSIREEEANEELFCFIIESLINLDGTDKNIVNFHLQFLLKLSQYHGFSPLDDFSDEKQIFNLLEGNFQEQEPEHSHFLNTELSLSLHDLIQCVYRKTEEPYISYSVRKQILSKLIEYYQLHLTGFNHIQSYAILEEILR